MLNPREARLSRGLTQARMAALLDIDPRRLADYESGRRQWPLPLLQKAVQILTQADPIHPDMFLSLETQIRLSGQKRHALVPEHSQSWAEMQPSFDNLYRRLDLSKQPSTTFRRQVRGDSRQEPFTWSQLFADGARPVMASPNLLGCRPYPPVDSLGHSLGLQPRAAIFKPSRYIIFPQLSIIANERLMRPDGMLLTLRPRKRIWVRLELDSGAHQNPDWDRKRDKQLLIPTLRFASDILLGLRFAQELEAELDKLDPSVAA